MVIYLGGHLRIWLTYFHPDDASYNDPRYD